MTSYLIRYNVKGSTNDYSMGVSAKDVKSAKKKIERKENKPIKIFNVSVIGYF